jgi:hypothetical protein
MVKTSCAGDQIGSCPAAAIHPSFGATGALLKAKLYSEQLKNQLQVTFAATSVPFATDSKVNRSPNSHEGDRVLAQVLFPRM